MLWIPAAISGALAGLFYWLGMKDGRVDRAGLPVGSRATGILLFFGLAFGVTFPPAAPLAVVPAGAYLAAWTIHRKRRTVGHL